MCCYFKSCLVFFHYLINIILVILGLIGIAAGILLVAFKDWLFSTIQENVKTFNLNVIAPQYILGIGIGLLVLGVIILLIGFCGAVGGCCANCNGGGFGKCLLGIYITLLFLVMLAFLAIGVFFAAFRSQMTVQLQNFLQSNLASYDDNILSPNAFSVMWFQIMQTFQCCGYNSASDFSFNTSTNSSVAQNWVVNLNRTACIYNTSGTFCKPNAYIPAACCQFTNEAGIFLGNETAAVITDINCPWNSATTYSFTSKGGCGPLIQNDLVNAAWIIFGVAFALALIVLLGIIAAILICCNARKSDQNRGQTYS